MRIKNNNNELRIKRHDSSRFILYSLFAILATLYSLFFILYSANAATLYLYPDSYTLPVDETVVVDVRLDTEGERVNAVEIEGTVSPGAVEAVRAEMSGSFLPIILEIPTFTDGRFRFVGSVPGGFTGDGVIGRLTVMGASPGEAVFTITENSRVLLHSENGEELTAEKASARLDVVSRGPDYVAVTSTSHAQGAWSSRNTLYVNWEPEVSASYSYHLSQLSIERPDTSPDKPVGEIKYQGLSDGIYYFSICKLKEISPLPVEGSPYVCGVVSRYRAMIDATAPVWLSAEVSEGTVETEAQKFLSFIAEDPVSGISRYEISVDGAPFISASSPRILTEAKEVVVVKAFDQAGNEIARVFDLAPKRSFARTAAYIAFGVALAAALLYALFR